MRFRTEIEAIRPPFRIHHTDGIVMLGSCFTDEVGGRLDMRGFNVLHNPFGALYNPLSILQALQEGQEHLIVEHGGSWHCLDYATRFSGADYGNLLFDIAEVEDHFWQQLRDAKHIIITLGTAFVFQWQATGRVVGNCHKLPAAMYKRRMLSVDEAAEALKQIAQLYPDKNIIFTVSPIRHTADGLHGNNLSKSTLLLAVDAVCHAHEHCFYFPAYEMVMDDLRDYRFYAEDMKHPSSVAVDYVYSKFAEAFFTPECEALAQAALKEFKKKNHRPIL